MSPHGLVSVVVATVLGMLGCGGAGGTRTDASVSDAQDGDMGSVDVGIPEKRCGETNTYFSAYNAEQIAKPREGANGDLYITDNTRLPRAEIDALVARVKVGGTTMVGAATDP